MERERVECDGQIGFFDPTFDLAAFKDYWLKEIDALEARDANQDVVLNDVVVSPLVQSQYEQQQLTLPDYSEVVVDAFFNVFGGIDIQNPDRQDAVELLVLGYWLYEHRGEEAKPTSFQEFGAQLHPDLERYFSADVCRALASGMRQEETEVGPILQRRLAVPA